MTREEKIEELRKAIIAQANAMENGWMTIRIPVEMRPGGLLRVPRAPFEHWAVDLAGGAHLASPWKPVSPSGVKQGADDPNHTDWMLGAGLNPGDMRSNGDNPHWEALSSAAYSARREIEQRLLNFDCSILLRGPSIEGRVHQPASDTDYPKIIDGAPPITVVRNAGPKWFEMALETFRLGGAVIVEQGGEMAHLVTEFRPAGYGPMVRREGARKLYPVGTLVRVDPSQGQIVMPEDEVLIAAREEMAGRAEPLADDLPIYNPPPPPHRPGFGFREYTGQPTSSHPSRNTEYLQPAYKLEGADWQVYASWHYSKGGHYDVHHGYAMYLHVMANSLTRKDARGKQERRLFISDCRIWKDNEVRAACEDVLYTVSPEARFEWQKWDKLRLEQRAREKAKLEAMSDDALIRLMTVHGRDEDGLWDDYESGTITNSERVQMLADYEKLFAIFAEISAERGLELDMNAMRPHKAHHQQRMDDIKDYERQRQEAFESVIHNVKPLHRP